MKKKVERKKYSKPSINSIQLTKHRMTKEDAEAYLDRVVRAYEALRKLAQGSTD